MQRDVVTIASPSSDGVVVHQRRAAPHTSAYVNARPEQAVQAGAGVAGRHEAHLLTSSRYFTRASSSSGDEQLLVVGGHDALAEALRDLARPGRRSPRGSASGVHVRRATRRGPGRSWRWCRRPTSVWHAPQAVRLAVALGEERLAVDRPAAALAAAVRRRRRGSASSRATRRSPRASQDVRGLAHVGVADAAQLRADDRVAAELVRRDADLRSRCPGRRRSSSATPGPRSRAARRAT